MKYFFIVFMVIFFNNLFFSKDVVHNRKNNNVAMRIVNANFDSVVQIFAFTENFFSRKNRSVKSTTYDLGRRYSKTQKIKKIKVTKTYNNPYDKFKLIRLTNSLINPERDLKDKVNFFETKNTTPVAYLSKKVLTKFPIKYQSKLALKYELLNEKRGQVFDRVFYF